MANNLGFISPTIRAQSPSCIGIYRSVSHEGYSAPAPLVARRSFNLKLECSGLEVSGECNLAAGIQVAQLALKHRQNKKQQQGIIVFGGSTPIFTGDGEGDSGFAAAVADGIIYYDFGVDPNIDLELALTLCVSMKKRELNKKQLQKGF